VCIRVKDIPSFLRRFVLAQGTHQENSEYLLLYENFNGEEFRRNSKRSYMSFEGSLKMILSKWIIKSFFKEAK
jgi:hypothetical protein